MTSLQYFGSSGRAPSAKFGDVAAGNYLEIQSNGYLQVYGSGRAYVDLNFDGATLGGGAAAPGLIQWNGSRIEVPGFDGGNTLESLSKVLEYDHLFAVDAPITVKPHLHWSPTTADAGDVEWFMDWFVANSEGSTVVDTVSAVAAAGGAAWLSRFVTLPDIVFPNTYGMMTQMGFALYRNPGVGNPDDTYLGDAALLTVGLHILVDSFGSCQVAVKECS